MVVTDQYIYVHMPKTGGTWVRNVMRGELGEIPVSKKLQGHSPASIITPEMAEGKTVFGSYRDPWSWYESWAGVLFRSYSNDNQRVRDVFRAFGQGEETVNALLRGAIGLDDHCPTDMKPDALWNPEGRLEELGPGGLWSRLMRYYFQDESGCWLVDEMWPTGTLPFEHRNYVIPNKGHNKPGLYRDHGMAIFERDAFMNIAALSKRHAHA